MFKITNTEYEVNGFHIPKDIAHEYDLTLDRGVASDDIYNATGLMLDDNELLDTYTDRVFEDAAVQKRKGQIAKELAEPYGAKMLETKAGFKELMTMLSKTTLLPVNKVTLVLPDGRAYPAVVSDGVVYPASKSLPFNVDALKEPITFGKKGMKPQRVYIEDRTVYICF
jgi:hypothetical protein